MGAIVKIRTSLRPSPSSCLGWGWVGFVCNAYFNLVWWLFVERTSNWTNKRQVQKSVYGVCNNAHTLPVFEIDGSAEFEFEGW